MPVGIPQETVVTAYDKLASPIFEKIQSINTLLPRLMSGELRVGEAKKELEVSI
jgi:hypothetical protein